MARPASASSSASAVATASFGRGRPGRRRAAERLGRRRLDEAVRCLGALDRRGDERVAEDDRAADRLEPEGAVRVAAQRVVDLGDHARHVEPVLGELRGQGIAVVALRQRHDDVGLLGAGRAHRVLIGAVAADRLAAERRRQAAEGARGHVDDDDRLPALVELGGDPRSDATAADDDHPHGVCASSFVSARRHHTGAVELRMT